MAKPWQSCSLYLTDCKSHQRLQAHQLQVQHATKAAHVAKLSTRTPLLLHIDFMSEEEHHPLTGNAKQKQVLKERHAHTAYAKQCIFPLAWQKTAMISAADLEMYRSACRLLLRQTEGFDVPIRIGDIAILDAACMQHAIAVKPAGGNMATSHYLLHTKQIRCSRKAPGPLQKAVPGRPSRRTSGSHQKTQRSMDWARSCRSSPMLVSTSANNMDIATQNMADKFKKGGGDRQSTKQKTSG